MLTVLFWITFGALVGWIATILQEGDRLKRNRILIVAGAIGGLLGGYGGTLLGAEALEYNASATGMMFAIFGAGMLVKLTGFAAKNHLH